MASFESNRKASMSSGISFSLSSTHTRSKSRSKPTVITPKIQESVFSESLHFRTNILPELKELGPPDLIHLSKYDKSSRQEIGEYHYALGLNTSSVIQPYMYLQTIQVNDKHLASDKHPKVGTYCSYNCFSKGDVRIRCTFPSATGPVVQFMPTARNKVTISIGSDDSRNSLLWMETFVSSLIRSAIFSDHVERLLPGLCMYNPMKSTKEAKEALAAMVSLLPKGHLVGSRDLINQSSILNNYLVDAIFKFLEITGYYDFVLQEIDKLDDSILNFDVLKIRVLLAKGDQTSALDF
ncbi:unnamed protein product [Ambrosiozyma monospora]|uniref:Unnamed protein product n=1 Tax=Ambrosiozyma monospora TaxID=43982 RepID=A0ACB5TNC9_AMBMO|nr:unnamed protein product [Ambrosiozyma monospora]